MQKNETFKKLSYIYMLQFTEVALGESSGCSTKYTAQPKFVSK